MFYKCASSLCLADAFFYVLYACSCASCALSFLSSLSQSLRLLPEVQCILMNREDGSSEIDQQSFLRKRLIADRSVTLSQERLLIKFLRLRKLASGEPCSLSLSAFEVAQKSRVNYLVLLFPALCCHFQLFLSLNRLFLIAVGLLKLSAFSLNAIPTRLLWKTSQLACFYCLVHFGACTCFWQHADGRMSIRSLWWSIEEKVHFDIWRLAYRLYTD